MSGYENPTPEDEIVDPEDLATNEPTTAGLVDETESPVTAVTETDELQDLYASPERSTLHEGAPVSNGQARDTTRLT